MKGFSRKAVLLVLVVGIAALAVSAGAVASTKKKSANVQVCVLLPDTQSSVRWQQFDKPLLTKAFAQCRRDGADHQRARQRDDAAVAGADVPERRGDGRDRDVARQRLRLVDREALHVEGRQGDRLRPPGHRRHGLGLRHVRRQARRQGAGRRRGRRDEGEAHLQAEQQGRRALGRSDRPERVLVQERQRRGAQQTLQAPQADEGAAEVRARLGREQRGDHLQVDALPDQQQDQGRHRGERQHRRRRGRRREGRPPQAASRCPARTQRRRASSTSSPAGRRAPSTRRCRWRRTPRPLRRSSCSTGRSRRRTGSG